MTMTQNTSTVPPSNQQVDHQLVMKQKQLDPTMFEFADKTYVFLPPDHIRPADFSSQQTEKAKQHQK